MMNEKVFGQTHKISIAKLINMSPRHSHAGFVLVNALVLYAFQIMLAMNMLTTIATYFVPVSAPPIQSMGL
jgi:hypothetical protein